MRPTVEGQFKSPVDEPFRVQPRGDPRLLQQCNRTRLQKARANPRLDIPPGARLHDERIDPVKKQQLCQQETGGSCTDDGHLGSLHAHHVRGPPLKSQWTVLPKTCTFPA